MGQTPSTLNPNVSQTTHTTSKSPIEQKYLSQNPTKFGSELDKFSQVQNLQYQSAPQTKQTAHLQTNLPKNNSKNLFGNQSNFVKLSIEEYLNLNRVHINQKLILPQEIEHIIQIIILN